jgi:hypothetical protein
MAIQAGETTFYQAKRGIVQDGLVLNLDAAVDASYSGGTTWRDLTGGNNGTLTNSPTFTKQNGGIISFDGSDEYINCGNDTSVNPEYLTLSMWLRFNSFSGRPHFGKGGGYSGAYYIVIETSSQFRFYYNKPAQNWSSLNGPNLSTDTWYNLTVSYDGVGPKIYRDGSLTHSASSAGTLNTGNNSNLIFGPRSDLSYSHDGFLASAHLYNRALTATEVLQNYNATRHRFGV